MKFKLNQRLKVRQQMKMRARLVIAASVFAFFTVVVSLTFIFNIGDVRSMFAQTDSVDRYWVGNSVYTSSFDNQWETDAWELSNDNGTGSWVLSGDGTGTITVDNAAGGYASSLKHSYDGAPLLLTLDKNYGRLDMNVTGITGGRTLVSVDAEQYDANNNYLSTITVMHPAAYCGYFVMLFGDLSTWHANATKVRFVINVNNQSSTQGTASINYFSYSNGSLDWKNPANWAASDGGAGGQSVPTGTDVAIFSASNTGTCNINGPLNVGGITMETGYNGMILQNANEVTVGSNGLIVNNGTFQGGSANITINGPLTIASASATFRSSSLLLNLNGDFTMSAGTFTHNSGRVVLGNNMTWTGSTTLNELNISATGTKTFNFATGTTITSNSTFTLEGTGNIIMNGDGIIAAKADLLNTNTGTNGGGTATVLVNGTGAQVLTGNTTVGAGRYPKLTFDKASGTLTVTNTVSVGNNFTYIKGGTTTTGSTFAFGGANLTVDAQGVSANMNFNNVHIDHNTSTTAGVFTVGGTLDIASGATLELAGFDATVSGNTTAAGTIKTTSATGTKTFNNLVISSGGTWDASTVDEEFVVNGNLESYGTFQASLTTGTGSMYYLKGNAKAIRGTLSIPRIEVDNAGNNASYTNYGSLTVSTSLRGTGGTLAQGDSAMLRLGILPNVNDMSITTLNASATQNTVEYNLNTNQDQEVFGTAYFHTIFSGSGSKTLRAATTVNGNVTIKDNAILDVSASNYLLNVKGNWINSSLPGSSLAPFNARTGTVTFTGTTPQTITSSAYVGGNSFYNLTFNNTSATIPQIVVANNDNATGTLTLTAGNIDLGSTTFTLGASVANKGTLVYTAGYFLNGTLKRWFNTTAVTMGNVAGRFPIGYKENATTVRDRSAYFAGTATIGGTLSATHSNATGNFDFPAPFQDNGTIVDVRHNMNWTTAVADGLDGSGLQLRLAAEGMPGVNNTAMLRIVKSNGVAPGTSIAGGGTNANPYANKQGLSSSNMNNTFYMGSSWNTNPLPITLLSFTAVPDGNRVKLDWVTATEENNDYFTIEKSKNGIDWAEVLQKAGAGNSNTNIAYYDYDNDPYAGTSYYRLKQTDFNGQFKYSDMVPVEFASADQDIEFNIFPNPASSSFGDAVQFTMNTEGMDEQPIVINVLDMSGRIVATVNQRTNRSILQAELVQSSNLKPGMYTVVAVIGKKQISKKLIIN
jgi:hypothetical protein